MSLPSPHLDDRRFQDLVDDAKRFIQRRCPEWTDHNVSDPGVALIEAFAQMVDQLSYRLNRVPEKIHLDFLNLLGVQPTAPQAARTELTFRLSAPQDTVVTVPVGTEVATPRTGNAPACVFTVDRELEVVPSALLHIGSAPAGQAAELATEEFLAGEPVTCFAEPPVPGDGLLIGLTQAVPRCAVTLRVDCSMDGAAMDPDRPPRIWEALCCEGWVTCEIESDSTAGLSRTGEIVLHVPEGHTLHLVGHRRAGWLRCRVTEAAPDQSPYPSSPEVRAVEAYTIGGTTTAVAGETVPHDELGISDGTPGQTFTAHQTPIVSGSLRTVTVDTKSGPQSWTAVPSFADSAPDDRHMTVDEVSGAVRFGPAIRQPDGGVRQYGAIPEIGARITADAYQRGGGRTGNVATSTLSVLRTPLALVARVENRDSATGGVDAESVDNVRQRASRWLRTQDRAVTAHDYETIAATACREAGRIECVAEPAESQTPGLVRVLVVPQVEDIRDEASRRSLVPTQTMLTSVTRAIEAARPIGVMVSVSGPAYQGVTVVAEVEAVTGADSREVQENVLRALYECLSPLPIARDDRPGWPLGRALRLSDLYAVTARSEDVESVIELEMYPVDIITGERQPATDRIDVGPATLFLSHRHQVVVKKHL
ncbi:putative baseplate assembly protein [Streptomyces olivoreticuli]|uniref:putative baseplate assembly protein n=1 Tax=Streptomyces olivoreticuli TaxID=68246 RepID=UPI002658EB48|nr:putative baseplate assembly protein [Streptomyces olivoreticuli]WKK24344.1 putative baseplate assembly protein [Streptomyces olivoreticuli]